jgi:hypothetical protein
VAVTEGTFKALFPEFAVTATAIVERAIDSAECLVSDTVFGDCADLATSYLAAHFVHTDPRAEPTAQAYGGGATAYASIGQSIQSKAPVIRGASKYLTAYERFEKAVIIPVFLA